MLRFFAFIFAVGFLALGILGYGYMPSYIVDGSLFGLFDIEEMLNIVYIVSGVLALLAMLISVFSKTYFQVCGILYGLAAILGFVRAGDLYIAHVNMASNILHLCIAVVALFLGFLYSAR